MRGLSLVAASGGHSSSRCAGLSLSRPLSLWSTGSRRAGSVAVAHGPSCSAACGISPDQGANPCPPHWQADSQPLCHQGSPPWYFLCRFLCHMQIGPVLFFSFSVCVPLISCLIALVRIPISMLTQRCTAFLKKSLQSQSTPGTAT